MTMIAKQGHVHLVGAGPGDPDLLTVKALRLVQTATVIVHDRLVSDTILKLARPDAQLIDVGKLPKHHPVPQANINALLISLARRHGSILRLKGGDPYMFGRGSEEVGELRAAGISFSVVPGITAAQGVAASTDVPLTHRGLSTGVRFVTGHCRAGHDLDLDWEGLADPETTLIVYMGRGHAQQISDNLIKGGLSADMPVMLVVDGTRPTESRHFATVGTMAEVAGQLDKKRPTLIVIGRVVELAGDLVQAFEVGEVLDCVSHA
jgi:uroporphyrin-III C-methyltransferase